MHTEAAVCVWLLPLERLTEHQDPFPGPFKLGYLSLWLVEDGPVLKARLAHTQAKP